MDKKFHKFKLQIGIKLIFKDFLKKLKRLKLYIYIKLLKMKHQVLLM